MNNDILIILTSIILFIACDNNSIDTPKPRMYPKVDYPERNYVDFSTEYCDIKFQYPDYFTIKQDEYFFDERPVDPCWFDLISEQLNCSLHCSYIPIENRAHFDELVNDVFKLASKHNQKANYRNDQVISNPASDVYGLIFELSGPVATPFQYFVTDSTDHFMRASIYFNSKVNPDSIAPVYQYVKKDLYQMIETFQW